MTDYDDSFEPAGSRVDLSDFDDDFSSAEAPSFDEVPDGKYQVRIDAVRLDRSQRNDPMSTTRVNITSRSTSIATTTAVIT